MSQTHDDIRDMDGVLLVTGVGNGSNTHIAETIISGAPEYGRIHDPVTPGVVRVSGGVMAGYLLTMVMPLIPDEGRTKQISGAVVMHVIIGRDGHVRSAEPISGPNLLRQPYLDAVRQWTYRPYMLNGQPVEVETTVVLNPQINATPAPQASH